MFLENVATQLARRGLLCLFISFAVLASPAFAANDPVLTNSGSDTLPAYDFKYENGLYATIAGFVSIKDPELKSQKKLSLKVDSFKKKFPVRAIFQRETAPLVVLLLGID